MTKRKQEGDNDGAEQVVAVKPEVGFLPEKQPVQAEQDSQADSGFINESYTII